MSTAVEPLDQREWTEGDAVARLRFQRRLALLFVLLAPIGIVLLYQNPPVEQSWYPGCYFHKFTGLHCAGCGTTRAFHHLLHGRFQEAIAYNVLAMLALPFLGIWALRQTVYLVRGGSPPRRLMSGRAVRVLFWVILTYWIVRNLPYYPCTLLAPHKLDPDAVVQLRCDETPTV